MSYNRWRNCKCGCGQTFEAYGRRDYFSSACKQKDYRRRYQAKVLAWQYVAEVVAGDMTYFPTAFEAYYSELRNRGSVSVIA